MFQFPIENIPSNYVIQNKPNSDVVTLNNIDDLLKHLYYSITEAPYSAMNKIDPSRFTFRHNLKYKISNSELDILDDIIIKFETTSEVDILLLPGTISIFIGCNEYIDLDITNTIKTSFDTSTKHNIQTLDELLDIKTITNSRVNYLYTIINIPKLTFIKPEHVYIVGNETSKFHGYLQLDRKIFIDWYKNIHSYNALNTSEIQYHSRYNNILPDSIYNMYLSDKYIDETNTLELDISMDNSAGKIFLPQNSIFSLTNINIEWVHNTEYILPVDRLLSGLHCHDLLPSNNLQLFYKYYYESPFLEISEKLDKNQRTIYMQDQKRIKCDKKLIKIPTYYNDNDNDNLSKTIPKTSQVEMNHSSIYINLIVCRINRSGKHVKYIPRIPGLDRLAFSLYESDSNLYNCIPQDHIEENYFPLSIFIPGMYEKGSLSSSESGYNMEQLSIINPVSTEDSKFKYKVSEFNFKYPDYDYSDPLLNNVESFYIPKDGGGLYIPKLRIDFECDKVADNQYLAVSMQLNKKIFYNAIKYCAALEDRDKLQLWLDEPCSTDRILTDKQLFSIGDQRNNIEPLSLYDKAAILEPANYWFENLFPQMETYRDIEDIRNRSIQNEHSDNDIFTIKTKIQYLKRQSNNGIIRGKIFIPRGTESLSIFQSPYQTREIDYMIYSVSEEDICLPNQTIPSQNITNKILGFQNKIIGCAPVYGERAYNAYTFFTKNRYEIARFIYTRFMSMPDSIKILIKSNFSGEDFINNDPVEIFKLYYMDNEIEDIYGITIPDYNNKIPTEQNNNHIEIMSDTSEILFSTLFMSELWDKINSFSETNPGTWIYFNFYKNVINNNTVITDKYIFLNINSKKWKEFYYGEGHDETPNINIIENSRFPYKQEVIFHGCMYEQCSVHNWHHDYSYCSTIDCYDGGSGCEEDCACYDSGHDNSLTPEEEWVEWIPKYIHCDYETKDMWVNPCEDIIDEQILKNEYKYIEMVGGNRLTAHLKIENIDKSQIESIISWFYINDIKIEPLDSDYTITINEKTYLIDENNGAGTSDYYNKGVQEGYSNGYVAGCHNSLSRIFNDEVVFSVYSYIRGYQSENGYELGFLNGSNTWDTNYEQGEIMGFNDGYNGTYDNQQYSGLDGICGSTAYEVGYNNEHPNGIIAKNDFNLGIQEGCMQGQIDACYRQDDRVDNSIYSGSNNQYYKNGWESEFGYLYCKNNRIIQFDIYYSNGSSDGYDDGFNCQLQRIIPKINEPITDQDRLDNYEDIGYVFGYNDNYETEIDNNNCYYDIGLLQGYIDGYEAGCQIPMLRNFNDNPDHDNQDYNDGYSVGYNETFASTIAIWDIHYPLGQIQGAIDGAANTYAFMTHPDAFDYNDTCLPSNYYNNNTKCGECVRISYFTAYLSAYKDAWLNSDNYIHNFRTSCENPNIIKCLEHDIRYPLDSRVHSVYVPDYGIVDNYWILFFNIDHNQPEQLSISFNRQLRLTNETYGCSFILFNMHGESTEGNDFVSTTFNEYAPYSIAHDSVEPPYYQETVRPHTDSLYEDTDIIHSFNWMGQFRNSQMRGMWDFNIVDRNMSGSQGRSSDVNLTIHENKSKHKTLHMYEYIIPPESDMFLRRNEDKIFKMTIFEDVTIYDIFDRAGSDDYFSFNYEIEIRYNGNISSGSSFKAAMWLQHPGTTYPIMIINNYTDSYSIGGQTSNKFNGMNIKGEWTIRISMNSYYLENPSYTYEVKKLSLGFLTPYFTIPIGNIVKTFNADTSMPKYIYYYGACYFYIGDYNIIKNLEIEFSISDKILDTELLIQLYAPDEDALTIAHSPGLGHDRFIDTVISDNGNTDIHNSLTPHTGKYKAHNGIHVVSIKDYVEGKQLQGIWVVKFTDLNYDFYDAAHLTKCKLHFAV